MCSYMVEPVRYRKVVVEMMGSGGVASPASASDTKPHILLTRDQELAISNAVETFEKKCEELRGQREGICDSIKQYRVDPLRLARSLTYTNQQWMRSLRHYSSEIDWSCLASLHL